MPADVREARTGLPVVDRAVQQLYATGWLHNHARLWLASYLVHVRGVHWRTGADWLYGHLLDGDLASNHLSWQWVAGTASAKPYLFNAENVARYAPPDWHSPGSVIDTDYDTLARRAAGTPFKAPLPAPPGADEPHCSGTPPAAVGAVAPDAAAVHGREVWLVHPWSLGALPDDLPPQTLVIGVLVDDFHRAWPWLSTRDGMRAHDRMQGAGILLEVRSQVREAQGAAMDVLGFMPGAETREEGLHRLGQSIVGLVHVGEHGVSTRGRQLAHMQDGAHRRLGIARDIGVPAVAGDGLRLGIGLDDEDLGMALG